MKVRVYKTPTQSNPGKVALGIPELIQSDSAISQLSLTQEEILPEPTTLNALFVQPTVMVNAAVNASRSVVESTLSPGFKLVVRPLGVADEVVEPLEVEEVVIPEGYIHLDDIGDWELYNYNRAWSLTDRNFDVLPGEEKLPKELMWTVNIADRKFRARFQHPITSVKLYFRRVSKIPEDFEWAEWTTIKDETIEFPYFGEYVFRGVPYLNEEPLPYTKEWNKTWEEPDSLTWSAIQLDSDSYQIRMEGILGEKITEVEAFENENSLGIFKLKPNSKGRTEKTFILNGVSDAKEPFIEYRFMRRSGNHRSLVEKSYQTLVRNYAIEPIDFKVTQEGSEFVINLQDPKGVLYSPVNSIQPFSGQDWNTGIQTEKLLVQLEIVRHQDGETRNYGQYLCNITKEKEPNFLESPPFKTKVERVNRGFSFKFEDTQEFRSVVNLDNPDLDKRLAYEFRLLFWTAGIEDCLRTGKDYNFIKETPAIIRNKRVSYKYSYSVWKQEHPRRKYTGIIPRDVDNLNLLDHIRYGRGKVAYVFDSKALPLEKTTNVNLYSGLWKVLYYYDDKEDAIVEHPYYSFGIEIPPTSQLMVDFVEVSINKTDGSPIILGKWHATDLINVVDFIGYYEERKIITVTTDFAQAMETLPIIANPILPRGKTNPRDIQPTENKFKANTIPKKNNALSANRQINNSISKQVETGEIRYNIKITLNDGKVENIPVTVDISDRPKMPEEPPENTSFTTGNKTVLPATFDIPTVAVATITAQIQQTQIQKSNTMKLGKRR